nr:uncharacterized protein LOC113734236 isoform X3 [Coffea arabica]XP_027116453.1 uncharacterized protein LOC113734236 isoform X3 [Coffea arabica]XP_027116454.1 uncharacterized protein LOC113734236 isoform X3 [Coffea arabica]XP_027116455.1 uncharacterized protein LOC113734236 isoform X3 [Coffea arabica]
MEKYNDQPFKVGQLVEARSFMKGYRGAWFRCKIVDTKRRDGHINYGLRYLDFPDEKDKPIRLYQLPPVGHKRRSGVERELMLRPPFPPIYHEGQLPPANETSEVIVITEAIWNVGDLVDWWKDQCFWSGKVTQILGNEEAMVELTPPPMGEGSSYKASLIDLRPSLAWSLEDGWKLPAPKDGANHRQCARLVDPVNQSDGRLAFEMPVQGEGTTDGEVACGLSSAQSLSSHGAAKSLPASEKMKTCGASEMLKESESFPKEVVGAQEENVNLVPGDNGSRKLSCSDGTYPHARDGSAEAAGLSLGEDLSDSSSPQKKLRNSIGLPLNSARSDTLDALILDLEELANKIKWLKIILKRGYPLSNAVDTSWMFVEHRVPSMPW